jgi:hypothetical protein
MAEVIASQACTLSHDPIIVKPPPIISQTPTLDKITDLDYNIISV